MSALVGASALFLATTDQRNAATDSPARLARPQEFAQRASDADLSALPRAGTERDHPRRNTAPTGTLDRGPASPAALSIPREPDGALQTRIHVVDTAGAAVAGASVEVWRDGAGTSPGAPPQYLQGRCDAAGLFVVEGGWSRLGAVAWWANTTTERQERATFETDIELVLQPARSVRGVVRDVVTGQPIAGAEVCIRTHANGDTVRSASDGTFEHPRLPAIDMRQQIRASATGYAIRIAYVECGGVDGTRTWAGPNDAENVHGRDADAWIELGLHPEATIRGRVSGPGGKPIAGARVRAEGYALLADKIATADASETLTDDRGEYVLRALRPDLTHALLVESPPLATRIIELAAAREHTVDVDLEPGATVSGIVLDPAGIPAEGLQVSLRRVDAPQPAEGGGRECATTRRLGRRLHTTTDAAGALGFEALGPHRYELRISRGENVLKLEELLPRIEEAIVLPPTTLEAKWLTLRGTVDLGAGVDVAGTRVEIRHGRPLGSVHVDRDGSFRFAGLDGERRYELRWYASDDDTRLLAATTAWAYEPVHLAPAGRSR